MLLVKNYIECYLNSLRALAKITSESFSYEVCNHAETSEEEGEKLTIGVIILFVEFKCSYSVE